MRQVSVDGITLESPTWTDQAMKTLVVNPLANYLIPRKVLKWAVKKSQSGVLLHSIQEPGGWRSMRAAYEDGEPADTLDQWVRKYGSFPMGLRNRKRVVEHVLSGMLSRTTGRVNIISIGSGMGANILEPMSQAKNREVQAYCIDLAHDAFEHGRELCRVYGICDRVHYIHGDANNVAELVKVRPDIVAMLGIIEYLTDEQVSGILKAMHRVMEVGGSVLVNATRNTSGTDRFLRTMFGLNLYYRGEERVRRLLERGGFDVVQVRHEPVGIYTILLAEKRRVRG